MLPDVSEELETDQGHIQCAAHDVQHTVLCIPVCLKCSVLYYAYRYA